MHRSAIGAICIDLPLAGFEGAQSFWADALGTTSRRGVHHPEYAVLGASVGRAALLLQATGDPAPRVHLDVHTDDVAAEVARLVALGAGEVPRHDDWVVLHDPVGTVFCVVPVAADDPVLEGAPRWAE